MARLETVQFSLKHTRNYASAESAEKAAHKMLNGMFKDERDVFAQVIIATQDDRFIPIIRLMSTGVNGVPTLTVGTWIAREGFYCIA